MSLLEQLDDHLLLDYLLRNGQMKGLFEEIVNFAHEHEPDQLANTIEQVFEYATDEPTDRMIICAIFEAIGSTASMAELNEAQLVRGCDLS